MGIVSLLIFLVIIPVIIGMAGARIISLKGSRIWFAALPMGFFLEMSLFQLLAFPWAMLNFSFSSLCIVFTCVLAGLSIISAIYCKKTGTYKFIIPSFSLWDRIYGIVALVLIGWQVYNMAHLDIGYWSSDDAQYGAIAGDAITVDILSRNYAQTGLFGVLNIQRALQTSVFFPAFISFVSGFSVAVVLHTVLGVYFLLLAYIVYFFLGKILFKATENAFVFLIVLSVLYIFGLYSIYSQTYRLLGPSTQGKAVLAVSLFPFLFGLMIIKLSEEYDNNFGWILLFLSAAATGMTLFGSITMIGNVVFPVIASLFARKRKWRNLRYILWGSVLPVIYGGIFFYSRLI